MSKKLTASILFFIFSFTVFAEEARLLRNPDIHGEQVVFVYAGDLWTVSTQGGIARRLTSHIGIESYPRFSPDGTAIAFSAQYDGNVDVYTIPSQGGEPKRLTFHPGEDQVLEWFPDGESILFRSTRSSFIHRFNRFHKIPADGGFPEVLPLPDGELASFDAEGSRIAYTRTTWEGKYWKDYRGGFAPEVLIYDFGKNSIENISDFEGIDYFPMWLGKKIYFLSDRNGTMNIFYYDLGAKQTRQVTGFEEYDVKTCGAGLAAIVYENGGYLYVLDPETDESRKLTVEIFDDKVHARAAMKNVERFVHSFSISPTGTRVLLEARGDVFSVPAREGDIRNLTSTPGIRESHPVWSPNGRWVAYFSDRSGEYELYCKAATGEGEEIQITSGSAVYYSLPVWSPDSRKILFSDCALNLYYVDIEGKRLSKIAHSNDSGESNVISGSWSPDSRWIAYAIPTSRSGYRSVFLYSIDGSKCYRVTDELTDDFAPVFDPDGKYLFFITNRAINPKIGAFEADFILANAAKVAVATLQADTLYPFKPRSDEEPAGKGGAGESAIHETPKSSDNPKALKIDFEGLSNRVFTLNVPDGDYVNLTVVGGKVFIESAPSFADPRGAGPSGSLHVFDMQANRFSTVISGINKAAVSANGTKVLYRSGGVYGIVDAAPEQKTGAGKLNLSGLKMTVDYKAEWRQIFNDVWRIERDFFYDPEMHGADWAEMKRRYEVLLPHVAHRDDLNYLLGDLLSELRSSHAYIRRGDMPEAPRVGVGLLGCDLEPEPNRGYYKIVKIYTGETWTPGETGPLSLPGLNVQEGDYLIAVNGSELRYPENPWSRFVDTVGKTVAISVSSEPSAEGARKIDVMPVANDSHLRYVDWVENNRKEVDEATGGRVGYIHMPDTATGGARGFAKSFYSQVHKEGLILDVRYNGGGFLPDIYMERLGRQMLNGIAVRYANSFFLPAMANFGPKVCLINGYAGSGGDLVPYFFRKLDLGPLVGTKTLGALIGFGDQPILIDNGVVSAPDMRFFDTEGEWAVENVGVLPDIEVVNRPDLVVEGRDPQLEKAIEVIMEKLEKESTALPERPN